MIYFYEISRTFPSNLHIFHLFQGVWEPCKLTPRGARGAKVGVSNERFSTKVKLWCKLDIHATLLSASICLPPSESKITIVAFYRTDIKLHSEWINKISSRCRVLPAFSPDNQIFCLNNFNLISGLCFAYLPFLTNLMQLYTHICRIKGCGGAGWPPHQ